MDLSEEEEKMSTDFSSSPMVPKPYNGKGVLLVEVPIFYEFEFDYDIDSPNQQQPPPLTGALSSELIPKAIKRRTLTTTKSLSTSETFDFTLPDGCNPMDDEVTRKLSQSIPSVCKNYWLPLAQRLKGWKCEIRQRVGGRCDKFYQHERSEVQQFRSFKDVKRYIYLGFLPATTLIEDGEKFLDLHLYVSQQPDPKMS